MIVKRQWMFGALAFIIVLFSAFPVSAQKQSSSLKIRSIKLRDVVTPVFKDSQEGSRGARNRWCRFDVEYDIKGKDIWLSEVEVRWVVMVEADGSRKPIGMTQTILYSNVNDGKHFVCAYIRPKFFERYMKSKRIEPNRISVYVEIWVEGQRIDRFDLKSSRIGDRWYTKTDAMRMLTDELLPKSKTPFAALDYDFYDNEIIK